MTYFADEFRHKNELSLQLVVPSVGVLGGSNAIVGSGDMANTLSRRHPLVPVCLLYYSHLLSSTCPGVLIEELCIKTGVCGGNGPASRYGNPMGLGSRSGHLN